VLDDYNRLFLSRDIYYTLNMEEACSSGTSVYNKPSRCHITEDGILGVKAIFVMLDIIHLSIQGSERKA
jgi:hypothetical protein